MGDNMKKTKIIAVVMYSIVVVAIMGFLCYQCYTLTNRNIELNNAYKTLEALYTDSEQELSSLRSDYNTICEENQALIASSHDKKTVELLEMMIAAANSMNFYHVCESAIDSYRSFYLDFNKVYSESNDIVSTIETIAQGINDEKNSGEVYSISEWIKSNHLNYSSDVSYQLGVLNQNFIDTFDFIEIEASFTYRYYTSDDSDARSHYYATYSDASISAAETSNKAEEIISNIITYCIETLYSETNGK